MRDLIMARWIMNLYVCFIDGRVEPKILVERECQEDCPGGNNASNFDTPMRPMGRSLGDIPTQQDQDHHRYHQQPAATSASSNLPPNQTVRSFTKLYNRHRPSKTQEEMQEEKDEARARVEEDEEIFAQETNEQTLRMMHSHITPLLLNVSGAQVKTRAYEYLQILRKVVEKACPNDFIPPILLRGVMRMFRQLLWETQDTFTPTQHGDEDSHRRTLDVLSFCLNSTPEYAYTFNTLNDSYSNDTSLRDTIPLVAQWPNWAVPPERCPEPIIFAVNGSFYRREWEDWSYIRNITMIGIHLKFNVTMLDFVVETAWKIAIMGAFRCSWYFNETSYSDFYTFSEQTRSFFNEKIKKRWYYLPSVEKTYQIVQMMFPAHDLKKFAFGLDACMLGMHRFGAEAMSERIVSRPKITAMEEDLSQSIKYFDRYAPENAEALRAHALKSTDYAPKPEWPSIYYPKPGDTYPEQYIYKGKRRRRRNAAESFNMWGNTATCIRSYSEPWSRGQALGYHVPPGCRSPTGTYN
ncbi:unnamed protein product [Orchesella dallaii]|uniref:Uncharacterized protein n=1 Tax=Orchesella dallaii TaxID=48710 RepID=A0ABP1RYY8_9HEXA